MKFRLAIGEPENKNVSLGSNSKTLMREDSSEIFLTGFLLHVTFFMEGVKRAVISFVMLSCPTQASIVANWRDFVIKSQFSFVRNDLASDKKWMASTIFVFPWALFP